MSTSGWTSPKRSYLTKSQIALGDKTAIQVLEHLRAVVAVRYKEKFGHALTWEQGWAWEALSFIDNELNKPNRNDTQAPKEAKSNTRPKARQRRRL